MSGPTVSPEYLPVHVAEAEGYFAREGLAVTVRTTRAESPAADALAEGHADVAATSLEALLRFGPRRRERRPKLVFALTAAPPVALLVAPSSAGPRSVADLAGLRVGVTVPGAPEQAWLAWLLARDDLSAGRVPSIALGHQGLVPALEGGEIEAAVVAAPLAGRLVAEGRARLLLDLRTPAAVAETLGRRTVNAALFVRADRRPGDAELTALARALLAAEARIRREPDATLAATLAPRLGGTREELATRLAAARACALADGLVTADEIRNTLAVIRARAPLPAKLRLGDLDDMLLTEPLRKALTAPPAG